MCPDVVKLLSEKRHWPAVAAHVVLAQIGQTRSTQGGLNNYGWGSRWHVFVSSSAQALVPNAQNALVLNVPLNHDLNHRFFEVMAAGVP